jgi:catechol 2,3-dioxygenase-like lactoylglutathione lyase family enzyme
LIKALSHIAVRVTDMDKSLDFYCRVLGLPEQFRLTRDNGGMWLIYLKVADHQFIELFPGAAGPFEKVDTAALVHICLEVDDIQATYKELTARGLVPHKDPVQGACGAWQFWTNDPDGNPIEFHQFTPESKQIGPPSI